MTFGDVVGRRADFTAAILDFLENSKTAQSQLEIDQKHWKCFESV